MSRLGSIQGRFEKRPTASDPMAITAVNKLVSTTGKSTFRRILPCREP